MPEKNISMARDRFGFTNLDFRIFMDKSAGQPKYFARVVKPRSRIGERQYYYFYSKEEYDNYLKRKSGTKVQSPPVFKSFFIRLGNRLFKAQLGMFGEGEKEVQRPGSRGGRFYYTKEGKVVYGTRPVKKPKKPVSKEQYELLGKPGEEKKPFTQKEREFEFLREMAKEGKIPKGAEKIIFKKPTPSKKRVEREAEKWETGLFSPGRKQVGMFEGEKGKGKSEESKVKSEKGKEPSIQTIKSDENIKKYLKDKEIKRRLKGVKEVEQYIKDQLKVFNELNFPENEWKNRLLRGTYQNQGLKIGDFVKWTDNPKSDRVDIITDIIPESSWDYQKYMTKEYNAPPGQESKIGKGGYTKRTDGTKQLTKVSKPYEKPAKEPWEMTQEEWGREFEKTKSNVPKMESEKGAEKEFQTIMERQKFLKMGLKDKNIEGLQIPARHYQVIEEAIKQGKPVPQKVLDDYPELKKQAEGKGEKGKDVYQQLEKLYGEIEPEEKKKPKHPEKRISHMTQEQYFEKYGKEKGIAGHHQRVKSDLYDGILSPEKAEELGHFEKYPDLERKFKKIKESLSESRR